VVGEAVVHASSALNSIQDLCVEAAGSVYADATVSADDLMQAVIVELQGSVCEDAGGRSGADDIDCTDHESETLTEYGSTLKWPRRVWRQSRIRDRVRS
jgi:hypothetical protein